MNRFAVSAFAASIATALAVGSAVAANEKRNDPLDTPASGAAAAASSKIVRGKSYAAPSFEGPAAISAGNVRVALVWDPDVGIVRSKGVSQVRLPSNFTGLYCVRLISSLRSVARSMVPAVTADFSPGPAGNNLFAYFRSGACNSSEIGVQTQRNTGGRPADTDLVGFSLIAP
jgi:hypothetical protein